MIALRRPSQEAVCSHPHGLWSLWDLMHILDGGQYNQLIHLLLSSELALRGKHGPMPTTGNEILGSGAKEIAAACRAIGLEMSAKTAELMLPDKTEAQELHGAILQLANTVMLEMKDRKYYCPTQEFIRYYENPKLFGDSVFNAFPSANEDIFEAGTCLALERATACVIHLMRAIEVGLSVLAREIGVAKQNDWGAYLKKIQTELDARQKASGARTADEQFYAEAAAQFDRLHVAWRNPTMHPDKSYTQSRAEEILVSVRAFMAHLATRLHE